MQSEEPFTQNSLFQRRKVKLDIGKLGHGPSLALWSRQKVESAIGLPTRTNFLPRGTLLNTATVAAGALLGWAIKSRVQPEYQAVALSGLGLVTVGLGLKMFLEARHILIVAGAIAFGGMLGLVLGIQSGLDQFAEWAKHVFGNGDTRGFNEALVTTSILFCVGPLTLLGCLQDGLEGKVELLAIKSTLDGIGAIFFAASLNGPGVLVTAGVVLVVQSLLTFLARPLQPLAKDPELLTEVTGSGGVMLIGIGLGLLNIRSLPMATYLPALFLAPLAVSVKRLWGKKGKTIDSG